MWLKSIRLTLGASVSSFPLIARAQEQSKKLARIGILWHAESEAADAKFLAEFRRELRDLGYVGECKQFDQLPASGRSTGDYRETQGRCSHR
jgi:hypothetical protein